jgi:NADPH:quinone reductase
VNTTEPAPARSPRPPTAPRPAAVIRAVRMSAPGDPSQLRVHELEPPELAAGHVRVAVTAAGVNRSDVLACRGIIPGPFPRTLGRDFAGVVVDGAPHLLGTRVWGSGAGVLGLTADGTHASSVDVAGDGVSPIPDGLGDLEAAASALSYVTAFHALERAGTVSPGDTVVVTGAAGGVGAAAAALAHQRGARVVGVVKDPEEAAGLRAAPGAGHVADLVDSSRDDLPAALAELARDARAAVDVIGGDLLPAVLAVMGIGGGVCLLGAAPGAVAVVDTLAFYRQELRLVGLHTGRLSTAESTRALRACAAGLATGELTPGRIAGTHPLEDAARAYRDAETGVPGRPILVPTAQP